VHDQDVSFGSGVSAVLSSNTMKNTSDAQQQAQTPPITIVPVIRITPATPGSSSPANRQLTDPSSTSLASFLRVPHRKPRRPRVRSFENYQAPKPEEGEDWECKYLKRAYYRFVSSDWTGFKAWLPLARSVREYLHKHSEIQPAWHKIFTKLSDCLDEDYIDDEAICSFLAELGHEPSKRNDSEETSGSPQHLTAMSETENVLEESNAVQISETPLTTNIRHYAIVGTQ
jgi:hypothetical protein